MGQNISAIANASGNADGKPVVRPSEYAATLSEFQLETLAVYSGDMPLVSFTFTPERLVGNLGGHDASITKSQQEFFMEPLEWNWTFVPPPSVDINTTNSWDNICTFLEYMPSKNEFRPLITFSFILIKDWQKFIQDKNTPQTFHPDSFASSPEEGEDLSEDPGRQQDSESCRQQRQRHFPSTSHDHATFSKTFAPSEFSSPSPPLPPYVDLAGMGGMTLATGTNTATTNTATTPARVHHVYSHSAATDAKAAEILAKATASMDELAFDDGPVFRAAVSQMEKATTKCKRDLKYLIKAVESYIDIERDYSEQKSRLIESILSSPALEMARPYVESVWPAMNAARQQFSDNMKTVLLDPLHSIYEGDFKAADGRKKEFDQVSDAFYAYLSRYLTKNGGNARKLFVQDAKCAMRRATFELERFDYITYLQDLNYRKNQEIVHHFKCLLDKWGDMQNTNRFVFERQQDAFEELDRLVNGLTKNLSDNLKDRQDRRKVLEAKRDEAARRAAIELSADDAGNNGGGEALLSSSNPILAGAANATGDRTAARSADVPSSSKGGGTRSHSVSATGTVLNQNITNALAATSRQNDLAMSTGNSSSHSPSPPLPNAPLPSSSLPPSPDLLSNCANGVGNTSSNSNITGDSTGTHCKKSSTFGATLAKAGAVQQTAAAIHSLAIDATDQLRHKEGFLFAYRHLGDKLAAPSWKKYWCVLSNGQIHEYSHWKGYVKGHQVITLEHTTVREARNSDRRFCFEIVSSYAGTRTYQAVSDEERASWMSAVRNSIASWIDGTRSTEVPPHGITISNNSGHLGHREPNTSGPSIMEEAAEGNKDVASSAGNCGNDKLAMTLVEELRRADPANALCADCNASNPLWCSINLGILVCIECSGAHRSLGTHISKIRSLTLDTTVFTPELVELIKSTGNNLSNQVWEAHVPPEWSKPVPTDERSVKEKYVYAKYVMKLFINPSQEGAPATAGSTIVQLENFAKE